LGKSDISELSFFEALARDLSRVCGFRLQKARSWTHYGFFGFTFFFFVVAVF
jgi:hypothetical protein